MKNLVKIIFILLALNGLSGTANCQVSAQSDAGVAATIVEPATFSKTINSDFGHVTLIVAESVKMVSSGNRSRKGTIVLPFASGTFTAAIYSSAGSAGSTCTVSYPLSPFTIKSGNNTMQVASSEPVLTAGSDMIAGVYVSVTHSNVTINYN